MWMAAWQSCSSSLSRPVRSRSNTSATGAPGAAASSRRAAPARGASSSRAMRRLRAVQPRTRGQAATARARLPTMGAASRTSSAPAAIASASACGKRSGATSTSRSRPMVLMARAAAPMLPGCWVPTRTMRTSPAGCAVFMGANGKLRDGPEPTVLSPCSPFPRRSPPAMQQPAVNIMVKAARAGGNILLRHMHKLDAINVVEKDRMDYASEVDRLAEVAVVKELRRAYPEYAVLGEEGGEQKGSKGASRYTWVIDPLDGTSNYLRGFPHWCVSIALCEGPEPVHGVIFDPLRNELFTATRGSGAQLNERRIRVGERRDLSGALIGTGFAPRERARAGAQLECIRQLLRDAEDIRRTGSAALDLAYVACGRLDAYFEAGVKPWDIAAGALLVREAGGRVADFKGAATGPMDARGTTSRQILAGNVRITNPLQKAIADSGYAAAFTGMASVATE